MGSCVMSTALDNYKRRIQRLRARAEEVRAAAEGMHHPDARLTMLRMCLLGRVCKV